MRYLKRKKMLMKSQAAIKNRVKLKIEKEHLLVAHLTKMTQNCPTRIKSLCLYNRNQSQKHKSPQQNRAKNPQVMQSHNDESSDDDSPPQNMGNPFAAVKN